MSWSNIPEAFDYTWAFLITPLPICLTPSHPPQGEKLGQTTMAISKQTPPHTLTSFMQTLNKSRCNVTFSGCSSAPRTPAPERGTIISCGTTITHSPQRTVPQTHHENAPVPSAVLTTPTAVRQARGAGPVAAHQELEHGLPSHGLFENLLAFWIFCHLFIISQKEKQTNKQTNV